MKFFFVTLFLSLLVSLSTCLHAKVEIRPYKNFSWNSSWNESVVEELDLLTEKDNSSMLKEALDMDDLNELGCPGFNNITDVESKRDFWIVFFSALTRAESAFNPRAYSVSPKGGHGNYGLLQLAKATAKDQCGLNSKEELDDPSEQLRCGVRLMNWQLHGAPGGSGKLKRPDLKNQLFGKNILLWGPLRQNDKRGRGLLVNWFKQHLDQLSFCKE